MADALTLEALRDNLLTQKRRLLSASAAVSSLINTREASFRNNESAGARSVNLQTRLDDIKVTVDQVSTDLLAQGYLHAAEARLGSPFNFQKWDKNDATPDIQTQQFNGSALVSGFGATPIFAVADRVLLVNPEDPENAIRITVLTITSNTMTFSSAEGVTNIKDTKMKMVLDTR